MKITHISGLLLVALMSIMTYSCRKDELNPIPDYETGVNGFGQFSNGSAQSFTFGENTNLSFDLKWISIDKLLTVNKMEMYAYFTEDYVDNDGNGRLANHGAKLFKTIEGGDVPANRTFASFTLSQQDVYNLFKDNTFDYGDGTVKVFENPEKPDRANSATKIASGDHFKVKWVFTTTDGRVFDQWSDNVCAALPGSNCELSWDVVCVSDLAGEFDYKQYDMLKGNGDGTGTAAGGTITGTITWEQAVDGGGSPITGKYLTPDFSFGHFAEVWQDSPAFTEGCSVNDACNKLSTKGTDQYGDTYTYKILNIAGPVLTIRWNNTYGDFGTVELTRKDGKDWPALTGG